MGACNSLQYPINCKKGQSSIGKHRGNKSSRRYQKSKHSSYDSNLESVSSSNGHSNGSSRTACKESTLGKFAVENFCPEKLLTIYDLYNILNESGIRPYIYDPVNFLVIDSRDFETFSESHIVTANHFKNFISVPKNRDSLEKYHLIVIYGNEMDNDLHSQSLLDAMNEIEEYVATDILILQDGFNLFHSNFPYLCTDAGIETISDRKLLLCYPSTIFNKILFQGRGDQATNQRIINTLNITHIVNISEHKNAFPSKIKYLKLPLEDMASTNLSHHFEKTSAFIDEALNNDGRVLVHCNLGISRSSTITLAYLMKFKRWKLDEAFKFLKGRRTSSSPNSGFLKQLSEWEAELYGDKFTNIESLVSQYNLNKR